MGFKLLDDVYSARLQAVQTDVECTYGNPLEVVVHTIDDVLTDITGLGTKFCDYHDEVHNSKLWVRLNLNVASEEEWNMQEATYQKALRMSAPERKEALQAGRKNFRSRNPFKENRLWKMKMSASKLISGCNNTGREISFIMICISFLFVTCVK